ncbi:MAG: hypothetical protein ACOC7U_00320 [Spirochaetota bacterium]
MNPNSRNALVYLFLSLAATFVLIFGGAFLYSHTTCQEDYLSITSFRNEVVFYDALILFLRFLPPAVIFNYILCFTILYTLPPFQNESISYHHIASPAFVVLVILLLIVGFSDLFIVPQLKKSRESAKYFARVGTRALSYADELYHQDQLEKTISVLEVYFELDKKNQKAYELHQKAVEGLGTRQQLEKQKKTVPESAVEKTPPSGYSQKGEKAFQEGNYYTALFYLERALKLHPDNIQLKELYQRARQKVDQSLGEITRQEQEAKRPIQQKEKAIRMLENQDYYSSYYIFRRLSKRYPGLKDLALYLQTAENHILKQDFYPSQLRSIQWIPSMDPLIFLDRQGYFNTVERLIPWKENYYFYNITRYRLLNGKIYTFHAPYGKWMGGDLKAVRLKTEEGLNKVPEKKKELYFIHPYVHPAYLLYINTPEKLLGQLSFYQRLNISEQLQKSGLDMADKYTYLSGKMGVIFAVYVLAVFLSALGWARRSIYESPPLVRLVLFAVVVPLGTYLLYLVYLDFNSIIIYTHRYFSRLVWGGLNIAIYTALVNFFLAFLATFYFMVQSSRMD